MRQRTAVADLSPEEYRAHRRKLSRGQRYGLTPERFDHLLLRQAFMCKICGTKHSDEPRKGLVVDHDHKTGRVRGLLCHSCNIALGHLRDDPRLLRRAADYLSG